MTFEPTYSAYCDADKPFGKQGYPEWLKHNYEQRIHALSDSLEKLTPGSFEFRNDPERCIGWIKERLAGNEELRHQLAAKDASREADKLDAAQHDAELRRKAWHECADFICRVNSWIDRARMQQAIDRELEEIAIERGERRV